MNHSASRAVTSVTRDDLADGGAEHFKNCINEIRKICDAKIEILTPDFRAKKEALDLIIQANPEVFNHNIETVDIGVPVISMHAPYEVVSKADVYSTFEAFSDVPIGSM